MAGVCGRHALLSTVMSESEEKLVEGEDYYIDPATGLLTFTAEYLKKRGYCCHNGCRHCPYGTHAD